MKILRDTHASAPYDFGYETLDEYSNKPKEKVVLCMRILMWNKLKKIAKK